ncbi:hypothetical protein SLS59_009908 [Nothophoma quercina]|uniref:Maltose permease n=1 Tax=Nothophoma quercina TaxID=749835 RepID=A0ABR3QJ25_9PLEO
MAITNKDTAPVEVRKLSIAAEEVREAIEVEHTLKFWEAVKLYPKAIGWSMYFSLGVIMLGIYFLFIRLLALTLETAFDPQLLGNLYAMPAFQKQFGYAFEDGYIISAAWQTSLGMGNPIGQVVGALAAGYPMEWYGRKKTFNACVFAVAGLVFIQFFARSLPVLLAGELLAGLEDAEKALASLSSEKVNVKAALAQIVETDTLERDMEAGSTYYDVFRKINWRRTEIAIGVYTTQVLCGVYLINYGTYFFSLAGLGTDQAYNMGIGFMAVGWISVIFSWYLMQKFGRRVLFGTGLAVLTVIMFLVGILDCVPAKGAIWAKSAMLLVWNSVYNWSVGPVAFAIFCEVSATRVRSKTIAVATAVQALVGIIMTVAIPYLINPDEANLGGKLGFFFGGLSVPCLVWWFLRVPEMKGRTYEELDIMFERNVKTRQFRNYQIQ